MHQVTPIRTFVLVWLVLTMMTVLTWSVAYIDMGPFNIVVAMLVALFKMSLVVWFFMNVRRDNPLTKLFVGAGFLWLLILLALTLGDYKSREWLPGGTWW